MRIFLYKEYGLKRSLTVEELLKDRALLKIGDEVNIYKINDFIDELAGVLVELKFRKLIYTFPLADLEAKGKNYQPIKDYVIWFANR